MGSVASGGVLWGVCELSMTLATCLLMVGLCSCLPGCLAWSVQHWSLKGGWWSLLLVSRWIPPGEHMLINIPWAQEFSGGPASWTQCSHPGGSGLTSGRGTKSPQAALCGQRKKKEKKKKRKRKQTDKQNPRQTAKTLTNSNNNNTTHARTKRRKQIHRIQDKW